MKGAARAAGASVLSVSQTLDPLRLPAPDFGWRALTLLAETDWQDTPSFAEEFLPVDLAVRGSVAHAANA